MPFFDTRHQRAALILGFLAISLAVALAPYATGLLSIPVLFVILEPAHRRLKRWMRPAPAALAIVLLTVVGIVVPGVLVVTSMVDQAQSIAAQITSGKVVATIMERINSIRIGMGLPRLEPKAELARIGEGIVTWIGGLAVSFVGTATRLSINLVFALFGLYYLLCNPVAVWRGVVPYIPFSRENTEILRERFRSITNSTVIGTGLTSLMQGAAVAVSFAITGIANPLFWGAVTVIVAILPVVGSGMVWGPGVAALLLESRPGAAIFIAAWNLAATGVIDYFIRPLVYNRFAQIHPLITLVGAVAGVSYLGILGLLVGPLALSYFFEILRMYRQEFAEAGSDLAANGST